MRTTINKDKLYIFGPCGIENAENYFKIGEFLYRLMIRRNFFYKASYDKANRSSVNGLRGVGLDNAIPLFKEIKKRCVGLKLTTDVHETWQVEKLVGVVDMIQVPAFLARQSDLVVECAKHFDFINIKKGQWLTEYNVLKSIDKVRSTNENAKVYLTERGCSFGGYKLLIDPTIVEQIKSVYDGYILDTTHSTQRSREVFGVSGDRELAKRYFLSAGPLGYTGVFAETHFDPENAVSDRDCQIYMSDMGDLVNAADEIDLSVKTLLWKEENKKTQGV